jgi:hypothetical protein
MSARASRIAETSLCDTKASLFERLGAAPKLGVALCLRDVGKAGFAGPVCRKFANLTAFS